jgi:hypothetical protein
MMRKCFNLKEKQHKPLCSPSLERKALAVGVFFPENLSVNPGGGAALSAYFGGKTDLSAVLGEGSIRA